MIWQPKTRSIEFRRTSHPGEETMAAIKTLWLAREKRTAFVVGRIGVPDSAEFCPLSMISAKTPLIGFADLAEA